MRFVFIRHSAVEHHRVDKGSCFENLVCVGEIVGKTGEVGGRDVVSVRCGKVWSMTRG